MNQKILIAGGLVLCLAGILAFVFMQNLNSDGTDNSYRIAEVQNDVEVTVYNGGIGLVKEIRETNLSYGINNVKFIDVPSLMDVTSLRIKDINNKAVVLEQNYDYDLISSEKLLEKYIDKNITLVLENGTIKGKLLSIPYTSYGQQYNAYYSAQNSFILQTDEGIMIINEPIKDIIFAGIPENLATKPTLSVSMDSKSAGKHDIEFDYLTGGMNWNANYVCVLNSEDKKMDMNGWITISNNAGTTYKNAKLKVVAGDIHRVRVTPKYAVDYATTMGNAAAPQVKEEGLFEYHLYTIPIRTTLKNNQDKQISFLDNNGININKIFEYDTSYSSNVMVKVKFKNSESNNLGIPLPKGKVRIYKADSEGKLQFLGEDEIQHIPKDEDVFLYVGDAFDIVAEKTEIDRKEDKCYSEFEYKVDIRNHKKEDIIVSIAEHPCSYCNWEVLKENFEHNKESTSKISWEVPVKGNGNATLTYRVLYRFKNCKGGFPQPQINGKDVPAPPSFPQEYKEK